MVLDFLRRKKEVHLPTEAIPEEALPEELERFRIRRNPEPEPQPAETSNLPADFPSLPEYGENVAVETNQPTLPEPPPAEIIPDNRIDLILQKLETIDTRLKLIEERLRR